jgi:uncharacterized membrane protein YgcG
MLVSAWKRLVRTRYNKPSFTWRRIWVASSQRALGIFLTDGVSNITSRIQSRPLSKSVTKTVSWLPTKVPNPMESPEHAGRIGVVTSCISDPDNILSKASKDVIEGYINASKTEMAAVVISKMSDDFINANGDNEDAAKAFATQLHDAWGVGNADTNDGVLILLSIQDRVVHFSTGSGVEDRLDSGAIQSIVEDMRSYLQRKDYGGAMELAVLQVDATINDDEARNKARLARLRKSKATGLFGLLLLFMFLLGGIFKKSEKERYLLRLRSEDDLERIYDSDDVSCAHCLGTYDNNVTSPEDKSYGVLNKVTLECGHKFCNRCYNDLLAAGEETGDVGSCTICAAPLAVRKEPLEPKAQSKSESRSWFGIFSSSNSSSLGAEAVEAALYRLQRYRHIYRDVVHSTDMEAIEAEIKKGIAYGKESMRKRRKAIKEKRAREEAEAMQRRKEKTERRMADEERRRKAEHSGSSGSSSSSWGGGGSSSGGGGGGSW